MTDDLLFPVGEALPQLSLPSRATGVPRVQRPVRNQVEYYHGDLDSLIECDHPVRVVWEFVQGVDVSNLYQFVRTFEGSAGRPPIDPRILLALWLYATLRGVGSAHVLDGLCSDHVAFRWLCGGVSVNYHTLSDFRSDSAELLDSMLIDQITALCSTGLVTMDCVAHDGLRTRASAAPKSFRGKESLEEMRQEAEQQVKALEQELHDHPAACSKRQASARERAARERLERVEEALKQLPDVEAKKKDPKRTARVSTTDPDARVMKMPNGGFNPAFNVQLSADTGSQIIVGASVTNCGSDHALLPQAIEQIETHAGCAPKTTLVDGGFNKPENIEKLSEKTEVYAPATEHKDKNGKPLEAKKPETPAVKACRERMESPEGKELYKLRASTIECVNALARNRGLKQFLVRGLEKVESVVLLFVLVHNIMRTKSLMQEKQLKAQAQTG